MSTKKTAFTLIEMLITLSIFAVVSILSVTLLVNGLRSARKIQAQVLLYSETQALMDQIARDVERNTVDYEAYYSRTVQGETGWHTPNYGEYAQTFYDPGTDGSETGPYSGIDSTGDGTWYGVECSDGTSSWPIDCSDETPVSAQGDHDMGAHPFPNIDSFSGYVYDTTYMNAFCEDNNGTASTACTDLSNGIQDELILVNGAGDARTVYSLEAFDSSTVDYYLSKVELSGTDSNNDGVVDAWECTSHYTCTDSYTDGSGTAHEVPDSGDLSDDEGSTVHDFAALSPDALTIEEFHVIISPFEDPYRAFAETDEQIQPQITILMKVTLSSDYGSGILGELPSIFVQRTISTGVYGEVQSYE